MGRTPGNGAPSFRFTQPEVSQMEAMLTKYEGQVPPRDLLEALAQRFSNSPERAGKMVVHMKQVWNWFQNRRYALRAKLVESPGSGKPSSSPVGPVTRAEVTPIRNVPSVPQHTAVSSGPHVAGNTSDAPLLEYEAKSARDGAWYDVQLFLSIRHVDTDNPDDAEALVRFAGFGPEEDEWVKVLKNIRQRSLPCEASECFVVTSGDLILCFQEGKEQALYFDAHVLDAQRRRHDVRGCRCRFLVRYDHDQSEEIVPLRKICRRPETDYRLQAINEAPASTSVNVEPPVVNLTSASTLGMTNPNPITPPVTAAALPPSPVVSAGPSFQPPAPTPAPFSAPAPTLTRAPTPAPFSAPAPTLTPALTPVPFSAPAPTLTRAPTPAPFSVPAPAPTLSSFGPPGFPPISALIPSVTAPPPVSSPFSVPVTLPIAATPSPFTVSAPSLDPVTALVVETPAAVPDQKTVTFSAPVSDPVAVMVSETPAPVPDQKIFTFSAAVSGPVAVMISETPAEQKTVEIDIPPRFSVPDPKQVESGNLAQIPVSEPEKVESVCPAQILVPVLKKAESVSPTEIPVLEQEKVNFDNPAQIPVPELKKVENDIPAQIPVFDPKKAERDMVETINPTQVTAPVCGPTVVETNIPAFISVPLPETETETYKIETDNQASASTPELNKVETVNPAPVSAPELNKVETEPNKAENDILVSATNPNEADSNIFQGQLSGNPTVIVPGQEKAENTTQHGTETALTVTAGKIESTEPTENVKE